MDVGVKELVNLDELRDLQMSWEPISDESLRSIGQIKRLQKLSFDADKATAAGFKSLEGLTELQSLSVYHVRIEHSALRAT